MSDDMDMDKITRYADAMRAWAADDWPPGSEEQAEVMVNDLTEEEFVAMQALVEQRIAHGEEQTEALINDLGAHLQGVTDSFEQARERMLVKARQRHRQRQLERLGMATMVVAAWAIGRWSR